MDCDWTHGSESPTHGSDTAVWNELVELRSKFQKWRHGNRQEFWDPAHEEAAKDIAVRLENLIDAMNEPL